MSMNKRREVLSTLMLSAAAVPVVFMPRQAAAAKNDALRAALKYQDSPKDGNECDKCLHWKAPGSCAILPGDTEISPTGWCSAYVKKG